jgi:DNA-directed RNA polymerase subunit RPC12/RpoP
MPDETEVICPRCWGEFTVELEKDEEIECEECGELFFMDERD